MIKQAVMYEWHKCLVHIAEWVHRWGSQSGSDGNISMWRSSDKSTRR